MRRVAKADARMKFAEIVGDAEAGERVKLTHYGKTIAVLISTDDLRRLQNCEDARAARNKKAAGDGIRRAGRVKAAGGRR
jgi:prevent-host-death family protein